MYSLIATCKSAEVVDPRIWMEDVLSKIPYYESDDKNMEELLHVIGQNPIKLVPNRYY